MENKFASIKNPLSVIAIFAGIAEISGTAVLPLIAPEIQALYIWFLMLFPFALVGLFFLTLNFNHRVLYAPSDFRDEDNFVHILKKSTHGEVLEYKEREASSVLIEEVMDGLPQQIVNEAATPSAEQSAFCAAQISTQAVEQLVSDVETALVDSDALPTREQRSQLDLIARRISVRRMRDARCAEKLALESLEKELGVSIEREMKIEFGSSRFHFDGIARRGSSLTAIEVKYARSSRSLPMSMMTWQELRRGLESLYQSLAEQQRREFSFILVIVSDSGSEEIARMAEKRLDDLPFPTAVKLYDFDTLLSKNSL